MADNLPKTLLLRPSSSAFIVHSLCMALSDLLHAGGQPSRRSYLIMCGLASAAEAFSGEASRWFGSRPGKDQDLLDELEDRYLEEVSNNESEND